MGEVLFHKRQRKCELNACLWHIMKLCRWAGFFPVEGSANTHPGQLRFNLKSVYSGYYGLSLTLLVIEVGMAMNGLFSSNGTNNYLDHVAIFFFCMTGISTAALLYRLAKQWPQLIETATDIEHELAGMKSSSGTHVKTSVISYTVLILAMMEYVMRKSFKMGLIMKCLGLTKINSKVIEEYVYFNNQYYFDFIPYNIWTGILKEFSLLQETFLWNFTDVMGMCFSIYLTAYFQDLEKIINSQKPKDWAKIRAAYSRVIVLLNLINNQLAPFILLASFTNLFFICLQLFNCLHREAIGQMLCDCINNHLTDVVMTPEYLVYYLFSFTFLITRATMFAHYAANVHTSAYKSVLTLYEVPASEYNVEVQCLQMQLRFTTVGLSGVFFYVERKMILRVIGTIITYELVLLQFSSQGQKEESRYFNYTKGI